jgi:integrase
VLAKERSILPLQIHASECNLFVINCHKNMKNEKFPKVVKVGSAVVKIYRGKVKMKRGRYDAFTVAYYQNGGRQRSVFGNFDDAKKAAQEIATRISHGRVNVKELTGADRESYIAALNLLEPLGVPLHSAVEEYVANKSREREPVVDKPIRELVEELLVSKKRDGLSLRYIQSLRSHLRRFATSFPTGIGAITSKIIEEWLAALGVGPRARNNIRMSIVTLFEYARRHSYLPKHQHTEAEDVPRAKERGGEIGILRPKELSKLLAKADGEARLFLALGAFTGLRTAELIRLEWSDINFERGHIVVGKDKSKTATRRLVPIHPNLMQWLAPYRGMTGRVFVSEHAADRTIGFAKQQHVKWPSNALRHSYATYRLAGTQDAAKVALEMGNSPTMLFTNYRELADERDATAWFAIAPKRAKNVVPMAG